MVVTSASTAQNHDVDQIVFRRRDNAAATVQYEQSFQIGPLLNARGG